jgi:hypothetical protein
MNGQAAPFVVFPRSPQRAQSNTIHLNPSGVWSLFVALLRQNDTFSRRFPSRRAILAGAAALPFSNEFALAEKGERLILPG